MNRPEYILNRLPIGLVMLDGEARVSSFSSSAAAVFGEARLRDSLGLPVQSIHPPQAHAKIDLLLRQSREAGSSGFASMLINVPDRVLQLRVIHLTDATGEAGYCMILYDITEMTSQPPATESVSRRMHKLPVSMQGRIALIDLADVAYLRADGHYTEVSSDGKTYLCGLPISQLEPRLPTDQFLRVHRSYIVNMAHASAIKRNGDQMILVIDAAARIEIPVSRAHSARLKEVLGV